MQKKNPPTQKKNPPTTFRLSALAESLLSKMAEQEGVTRTAMLETAIREAAKSRGAMLTSHAL